MYAVGDRSCLEAWCNRVLYNMVKRADVDDVWIKLIRSGGSLTSIHSSPLSLASRKRKEKKKKQRIICRDGQTASDGRWLAMTIE